MRINAIDMLKIGLPLMDKPGHSNLPLPPHTRSLFFFHGILFFLSFFLFFFLSFFLLVMFQKTLKDGRRRRIDPPARRGSLTSSSILCFSLSFFTSIFPYVFTARLIRLDFFGLILEIHRIRIQPAVIIVNRD